MPHFGFDLGEFVLAAGAVGTAAMGIVEGFKATWLQPPGFLSLDKSLAWARPALIKAYGTDYKKLLMSLFRLNRSDGDLPRILRQGVRIGLDENNARGMEEALLGKDNNQLTAIAKKVSKGAKLEDPDRNILGRFEVAADARIDAALALGERAYINIIRFGAFMVALVLSLVTALLVKPDFGGFLTALITGLVAVPLAPIAKDVAKALQSAAKAIGGKS